MRSVCQQLLLWVKTLFDPFPLVRDHDMKQELTQAGEATLGVGAEFEAGSGDS
jgi:hypothetical protein